MAKKPRKRIDKDHRKFSVGTRVVATMPHFETGRPVIDHGVVVRNQQFRGMGMYLVKCDDGGDEIPYYEDELKLEEA